MNSARELNIILAGFEEFTLTIDRKCFVSYMIERQMDCAKIWSMVDCKLFLYKVVE